MAQTTETIFFEGRETVSTAARRAAGGVRNLTGALDSQNAQLDDLLKSTQGLRDDMDGLRESESDAAAQLVIFSRNAALAGTALATIAAVVIGTTSALVSMTRAAAESADELEKLDLITARTAEEMKIFDDSLNAVEVSMSLLNTVVVSKFGPALKEMNTALSATVLLAADIVDRFGGVSTVAVGLGSSIVASVVPALRPVQTLLSNLVDVADVWQRFLSASGYTGKANELADALRDIRLNEDQFAGREKPDAARKKQKKHLYDLTKLYLQIVDFNKQWAEQAGGAAFGLNVVLGEMEEVRRVQLQILNDIAKAEDEQRTKSLSNEQRYQEDRKALWASAANASLDISTQLFDALAGLFAENEALAKAFAITSIVIDTARGVAAVWAEFAALPPVAAALSAGVIAVGVAQAAAVANASTGTRPGGGGGAATTVPSQGAQTPTLPSFPGDQQGGGTFIVLGNEVFSAGIRNALQSDSLRSSRFSGGLLNR